MTVLKKRTQITWARGFIGHCKRMWNSASCEFIKTESFSWKALIKPGQLAERWKVLGSGPADLVVLGGMDGWMSLGLGYSLNPQSIKASYLSQRPDAAVNFFTAASVEGPPVILANQKGEGYANDNDHPFSYFISVFPSASTFSAVGLPAGITLNSSTGEISGVPLQGGTYNIRLPPPMPLVQVRKLSL